MSKKTVLRKVANNGAAVLVYQEEETQTIKTQVSLSIWVAVLLHVVLIRAIKPVLLVPLRIPLQPQSTIHYP